ncbi:MAG: hypothetical protein NVV60_05785 [Luteimonas sp.]|nr:hypothetical protein [Luteimonas sp.]
MSAGRKPTGLAAFGAENKVVAIATTATSTADAQATTPEATALPAREARRRGKGPTVALTYRIDRNQWRRLHELALTEGLSLNQLIQKGINEIFVKRGLPPL